MPQGEVEELRRSLVDLLALSVVSALWKDLAEDSIAENLASTLVKMLDADFVYVSISTQAAAVELACGPGGRVPAALIPTIRSSLLGSLAGSHGEILSPLSGDLVTILSTPMEFRAEAALISASKRSGYPTEIDALIQRLAASEATAELRRRENSVVTGHLMRLVDLSSDFIGVANLQGVPLFVNPAGLAHVGMVDMQEAFEHHVADFLEIRDRDRVRYEIWPKILAEGFWSGQLSFLNPKTGVSTPFLFECFRIDFPPAGPVAVGTISREILKWTSAEGDPDDRWRLAKKDDAAQAVARTGSLTDRERQVLLELAAGRPHKIIAHKLGISVRTVEVHRSRMMRRLGVRTLAEALRLAIIAGIVA
jgi:DNA-binding CsgD family transcriptional regulator